MIEDTIPMPDPDRDADRGGPPTNPSVFPPGDRLASGALQAVSPRELAGAHRSAAQLSEAIIMMVDDEALNIEMTEAFLADAGYTSFTSVSDSRRALDAIRDRRPAVLLLDLSMPHVGGLQILEAMRADEQLRHTPVIVLTGSADTQDRIKALAAGAIDFLQKPVDPTELALRLRNTLAAAAYRDFLAHNDSVTGLPNRLRYMEYAEDAIRASRVHKHRAAIVHVGIDRLGHINNVLGRLVGDHVIQRIAKRLASTVETEVGGELASGAQEPALFRFDGDEFAIVLPHVEDEGAAGAFISKLLDDATCAMVRGGAEIFVTSSIGIAMAPHDGVLANELVSKAGVALRKAKEGGRHRYEFFAPVAGSPPAVKLGRTVELRRALRRQELQLRFEARMDAATSLVVAADSSLHWTDASGAVLQGDELLELAWEADLGREVVGWWIEQVQGCLAAWHSVGLQPLPVRVSVSPQQVEATTVLDMVQGAMRHGLDAKYLIVEWQASPALDALAPQQQEAMLELAQLDVRLALGGFGTGACALASLGHLPLTEARLAPRLMRDMDRHPRDAAVMRSTLAFVRSMGWTSIVTGVQNLHGLDLLRREGASQYMGPVVGEPLAPNPFAAKWLKRRRDR